jgi:tetratricopeptide (TPR) repeat protein
MQATYGLCFYLWKTLVPTSLSPLYLLHLPLHTAEPKYLLSALVVVAITALIIYARHSAPWAFAVWASYGALLFPLLGFTQNGWQIAADRYTYLASLPWAVLLGAALYRWVNWDAYRRSAPSRWLVVGCLGAWLSALGVLTAQQTRVWHDSLTLWNHALAVEPTNDIAYTNRGSARREGGDLDGALADFDAAIRLNSPHAEPYTGRGDARLARGDVDGALADLDTAIRRGANTSEVYVNRGTAHQAKGALDAAIADFTSALRLNPHLADAYYNRGNARQAQDDVRGALADYDVVLQLDPQHANAYNNRGNARRRNGDLEGAIADYSQAVQLTPVGAGLRSMFERNLAAARRELAARPATQS